MHRQTIRLERILPVMAQVKSPRSYIAQCVKEGFDHPGSIFHENTLAFAQEHFRGVEGKLADSLSSQSILKRVKVRDA